MDYKVLKWQSYLLVAAMVGVAEVSASMTQGKWRYRTDSDGDMHGGVPMGIPNDKCDNAKDHLEVDWNNMTQDYQCLGSIYTNEKNPATIPAAQCTTLLDPPIHVCLPEPIAYRDPIPTSGAHRPLWAKFGEYRYLPKQRWLHNLEHGCAVFLYHPCADPEQVDEVRAIANVCLRKHIITPMKELSRETPFAVLTYGCKLLLPYVDADLIVDFLREHALDAPESSVTSDGQFGVGLERPAARLEDDKPGSICLDYFRQLEEVLLDGLPILWKG
ncbi:uncharacterized protein LOC110980648 [Acanthaster planci]|uniref:Uncharacterized protein LOC110980648 n=1 Tax=Acanthaster planci TaxID=133434 RepID=A0A8B7YLA9_ACAPL|nr:uncharacterized protein LOC110980648 [Acanthaster planci]